MQEKPTSFISWCNAYSSQQACLRALKYHRWPNGFECPRCGHNKAYVLERHFLHQCARCRHQTSVTAGTVFEKTKLPLPTWFAAIYLMNADKGGISTSRLSQMIGVQWRTAQLMLRKLRHAMNEHDQAYLLRGLIGVDNV